MLPSRIWDSMGLSVGPWEGLLRHGLGVRRAELHAAFADGTPIPTSNPVYYIPERHRSWTRPPGPAWRTRTVHTRCGSIRRTDRPKHWGNGETAAVRLSPARVYTLDDRKAKAPVPAKFIFEGETHGVEET